MQGTVHNSPAGEKVCFLIAMMVEVVSHQILHLLVYHAHCNMQCRLIAGRAQLWKCVHRPCQLVSYPTFSRPLLAPIIDQYCRSPIQYQLAAVRSTLSTMSGTNQQTEGVEATEAKSNGVITLPKDVDEETKLLEAFSEVASVVKVTARVVAASNNTAAGGKDLWITASYNQRNLPGNAQRKFAVQGFLPAGSTTAVTSPPTELPDALLMSTNPKGDQQLVIKAGADNISIIHQVWSGNRLITELHVPKTLHGGLLTGSYFSADVAWHPQSQAVAYIAERPAEEQTPVWGGPAAIKDAAATKSWKGVGSAVEDWGELHTGKRAPLAYIFDLQKKSVVKVSPEGLPTNMSYGQPCWAPSGDGLILTGWPHEPVNYPELGKRLGVVFCYNRPAQLFYVPITRSESGDLTAGTAVAITSDGGSAMSPCFTPSGNRLLFLSAASAVRTGTHGATFQLCSMDWPKATSGGKVAANIVDVVNVPWHDASYGFPGLYTAVLPDRPFLGADAWVQGTWFETFQKRKDENTLLVNTQWRGVNAIAAINLSTGMVMPLTPVTGAPHSSTAELASYTLQSIAGDKLIAIRSGPNAPPHVVITNIPAEPSSLFEQASGQPPILNWTAVQGFEATVPTAVSDHLGNIECHVMQVTPTTGDTSQTFESLVWLPKNRQGPLPTVFSPHGGPHAAMTMSYFQSFAYLVSLGYAVVAPNFRGSTGYGQAALESLPGNIGRQDVDDCMAALKAAVTAGYVDPNRVGIVGGSHGGFLAGHLIGQFPDAFKLAVMRNPVTNLSLMVGITDITDWCFVEVFGCEEGKKRASAAALPEELDKMYKMSPVAHAHNVKVPVTLMLGAKDRRVPPPDGLQYQAVLKKAGVPVRTLIFPEDTHALDRVQTEFEQWINVAWDMKTYVQ